MTSQDILSSWDSALNQFDHNRLPNDACLDLILNHNKEDILQSFGGLRNMIHLCLTHHNASTNIDQCQFAKFESIMMENGINIDIPSKKNVSIDAIEINEEHVHSHTSKQIMIIDHDHDKPNFERTESVSSSVSMNMHNDLKDININGIPINVQHLEKENDSTFVVGNLGEYYKSRLVIKSDDKKCFYFDLLSQWNNHGHGTTSIEDKLWLYHFITSTKFSIGICLFIAFLCLSGVIINIFFGETDAYFVVLSGGFFVGDILCFFVMLTGNKMMYYLTFATFDFWFINWNVINIFIARTQLGVFNNQPLWHIVLRCITLGIVMVCASTLDALSIPNKYKVNLRIVLMMYLSYLGLNFYFTGRDMIWNPFKQWGISNSEISYKSVYLSSMSNLILFLMKPMFKQCVRKCCCAKYRFDCVRGCVKVDNHKDTSDNSVVINGDKYYQRCECLYRRPFVQYIKVE